MIVASRNEEHLAIPDHSMRHWTTRDSAILREQESGEEAQSARKAEACARN